ncbi:serine/threonine-protein phosphatase 1 regulatory subunit 10-like [Amblyomma americanum]
MAPIDPLQLLKALSPLLSPEGGIRSSDEVSRLSSLMKKFSRKLVSRCIYCNVLRATSPDILEVFLDLDGWSTIHMWLQEAKTAENMPFLCELLELCQILPMSLERLKENSSPKLIKSLMKSTDENVRLTAEKVVNGWMKLIKGDTKEAIKPDKDADATVKKKKKSSSTNSTKAAAGKRDRSKGSADDHISENNSNATSNTHGPSKSSSSPTASSSDKESPPTLKETTPKKPKLADRPKTVKTLKTRFRSTGLEEAPLPPPPKTGTKKVSRPAFDKTAVLSARQRLAPTVHTERRVKPSSLVSMGVEGRDTAGPGIRLIAPKPVHVLHEDGGFMDALTAAPPPSSAPPVRRKRKPSGAATAAGAGGAKGAAATSPTSPTPAAPKFQFYKDTLETTEAAGEEESEKPKEVKVEEEDEDEDIGKRVKRRKRGQQATVVEGKEGDNIESPEREDSPPTPTATGGDEEVTTGEGQEVGSKSSEGDDKEVSVKKEDEGEEKSSEGDTTSEKPASILSMTRKKTKKSVRWADESKLKQFHYFELDETERVNVNNLHNFGDMKTLEMKRERQAVETARRLMGDRMEEAIPFRTPRRLTLPEPLAEPGANSREKETQKLRQQKTLQEIYFSKEMIPDSPYEADPEQLFTQEPKIIPLEDENSPGGTLDYSHMELPKTSSLPPILSNLVLSIATKGQQPQGGGSPHQGVQQQQQQQLHQQQQQQQQQQLQGGLLPGQFPGGGPVQQQGALLHTLPPLHHGGAGTQIVADMQQQQAMSMMGLMAPDGGQSGMHIQPGPAGAVPIGVDPNGPPFMHPNSMPNQGIGMMGPPMPMGGAGGFPMGGGGPMHPHGVGSNAGDWGMMHPGIPQDGADYYGRGHHPGMGPPMGMPGPPMGAGGGPHMMDMPRGGPPHGRSSRMRNHPPRIPCKYYMSSQCRFGAGCSFLHPGVNGPPLQ